jgi:hypothetical protein
VCVCVCVCVCVVIMVSSKDCLIIFFLLKGNKGGHSSRSDPESKPMRQKYKNFIFCIEQTEQNENRK